MAAGVPTFAAAAADLVAHRAVYEIKLGQVRSGSNISAVKGVMSLVLEKTCDAWIMNQKLATTFSTVEGQGIEQKFYFTGWESKDGTRYQFVVQNVTNGKTEKFKGRARAGGTTDGSAAFTAPKAIKHVLPADTLFPIGHMAYLIKSAEAGKRQVPRPVFEGAEGEGHQKVFAFIGPRQTPEQHGQGRLRPLLRRDGWKMRLAFYKADAQSGVPQFEIELLQLDNGIVPRMVQEFPEFSLILDLKKLEAIAAPAC